MISFTFSNRLSARLERARAATLDFTPATRAIADYLRTSTVERFEDEAGPDGRPWQPSQRAIDEGGLTLTDRGQLRQSITAAHDASRALAGTNLAYAAIHQFGGKISARPGGALRTPAGPRASVTMPARPFLGFSPGDVTEIEFLLNDHVARGFGEAA